MKTIGAKIDTLQRLREERKALEADAKKLKDQADAIEIELMDQMFKEGVTKSSGALATASISETIQPSVENWDEFYGFIHKKKMFHLLQRRPAAAACRELFEMKGKIPGVVPFTERSLNLRSL